MTVQDQPAPSLKECHIATFRIRYQIFVLYEETKERSFMYRSVSRRKKRIFSLSAGLEPSLFIGAGSGPTQDVRLL